MFLHLFIISRSGGLIYNKDLSASAPKLSVNGWLIMGSTFHGLHSIAAQVCVRVKVNLFTESSLGQSAGRSKPSSSSNVKPITTDHPPAPSIPCLHLCL